MKGYVVCVYKSITNEEKLKEYAVKARAAVEKYKGKFLVRGGKSISNEGIGKDIITFWGNAIAKNKIGRALLRADQNLDIEYSEFIADPIETIKNIYDFLKLPLNSDELEKKQNFLKVHIKNKYGKHSYQLEDYGLTDNLVNEKISLNWQIQ